MSDRPIGQKLSLKPGSKFLLVNPPAGYAAQLGPLPSGVNLVNDPTAVVDAIQLFVANRSELEAQLPRLMQRLSRNGMLWVTYHKGTSKVKTDINRDTINAYAMSLGMRGIAMISIDEDWAALRLKHIEA